MNHWNSYWKSAESGAVVEPEWEALLAKTWRRLTDGVAEGELALDLATGNGQLIRFLSHLDLHWSASDLADIGAIPGVETFGGVPLEKQPFANGQFELVCSLFGLEYGPWPQSLAEAWRLVRPGGRLALVLHHPDSVISEQGRADLKDVECFLASDVTQVVQQLLEEIGPVDSEAKLRALERNPRASQLRSQLDASLQGLKGQVSPEFFQFQLQGIMLVVNQMMAAPTEQKVARWLEGVTQLSLFAKRLTHQLSSAIDDEKLNSGLNAVLKSSLPFTVEELRLKNHQSLAWVVKVEKPS